MLLLYCFFGVYGQGGVGRHYLTFAFMGADGGVWGVTTLPYPAWVRTACCGEALPYLLLHGCGRRAVGRHYPTWSFVAADGGLWGGAS